MIKIFKIFIFIVILLSSLKVGAQYTVECGGKMYDMSVPSQAAAFDECNKKEQAKAQQNINDNKQDMNNVNNNIQNLSADDIDKDLSKVKPGCGCDKLREFLTLEKKMIIQTKSTMNNANTALQSGNMGSNSNTNQMQANANSTMAMAQKMQELQKEVPKNCWDLIGGYSGSGGNGGNQQLTQEEIQNQQNVQNLNNAGSGINNAMQHASEKQTTQMANQNQQTVNNFNNAQVYSQSSKPKLKASDIKDDDDDQSTGTQKTDEQKKQEFKNQVIAKKKEMDEEKEACVTGVATIVSGLNKDNQKCSEPNINGDPVGKADGDTAKCNQAGKAYWGPWYWFNGYAVAIRFSQPVKCPPITAQDLIATNFVDLGMQFVSAGVNSFFDNGYYQFKNLSETKISGRIMFTTTDEKGTPNPDPQYAPFEIEGSSTMAPLPQDENCGNWYIGCKVIKVTLVEYCTY